MEEQEAEQPQQQQHQQEQQQPITTRRRKRSQLTTEQEDYGEGFSIEVSLIPDQADGVLRDPRGLGTPKTERPSFQILLKQQQNNRAETEIIETDIESESDDGDADADGRDTGRQSNGGLLKKRLKKDAFRFWSRNSKRPESIQQQPPSSTFVPVLYCYR